MKTKIISAFTLLAAGTVTVGCGGDEPLAGTDTGPLRAVYRAEGIAFEPDAAAWETVPARTIALTQQAVSPPMGGGATPLVSARAMHDGEWLAIRLQWKDDMPNRTVGVNTFRDSVSIGFPATEGGALPSPFMGDEQSPVNIWQWTADFDANARGRGGFAAAYPHTEGVWYFPQDYMVTRKVRAWRGSEPVIELEARGFGSLERKSTQNVYGAGVHDGTTWRVVLRRRLETGNPQDVRFRPGESTVAIFAVWNGTSNEVNGKKSVTMNWTPVHLDDTRSGG